MNYWTLKYETLNYPEICAAISCSKDKVAGECCWDLQSRTMKGCFHEAIEISKKLTAIGPADRIVLMSCSKKHLWTLPGMARIRKEEREKTFAAWKKINGKWQPEQRNII